VGCGLLLVAAVLSPGQRAEGQPSPSERPADDANRARLEVIENLSESLANDLLELSVATREGDLVRTSGFFGERLSATPFPSLPQPLEGEIKWIGRHGWSNAAAGKGSPPAARAMSRAEFMHDWTAFLEHFAEIEDARFKVKESSFDDSAGVVPGAKEPTAAPGSTGRALMEFYVLGRNTEGQREWARGTMSVKVRRGPERWQFESLLTTNLESMVSTVDLFSEVSEPAGVALQRPAYGSGGNGGFVWSGAAAGDINRDGWIDLFVTGSDRNYLYLNEGNGRFRDATDEVGLRALASGVAPLLLDYDNDGDQDVFLSAVGPQVLLENRLIPDGRLSFWDVSLEAGVAIPAVGFSATCADVNGDGRQDIYVASYNYYGRVTPNSWFHATNGTPNLLFVSQPHGGFREEARKWGVEDPRWSYAAAFADVNEDGRPDLYVANDFGEKGLFIHQGDRFTDEARERGVLDPGNGMGVAFGDYNNDGLLDLHVTNMSSTAGNRILSRLFPGAEPRGNVLKKLAAGNSLYENLGNGRYRDVTAEVGGFAGGWAWGGGFIDFDNDGWEDLFTPNGFISGKSMKDT
jgi:hypothetical protein